MSKPSARNSNSYPFRVEFETDRMEMTERNSEEREREKKERRERERERDRDKREKRQMRGEQRGHRDGRERERERDGERDTATLMPMDFRLRVLQATRARDVRLFPTNPCRMLRTQMQVRMLQTHTQLQRCGQPATASLLGPLLKTRLVRQISPCPASLSKLSTYSLFK